MAKREHRRSDAGRERERITRLSSLQLVKEIALAGGPAREEAGRAGARPSSGPTSRTEAKVAGGLGLAAVGAIITVTLLLVTAALALALVMPAWAAGLIVTGVRGGGRVAIVAGLSWKRRVRKPLQAQPERA